MWISPSTRVFPICKPEQRLGIIRMLSGTWLLCFERSCFRQDDLRISGKPVHAALHMASRNQGATNGQFKAKYAIMVSIESRKLVGSFPRLPQKVYNMPPVIAAGTMSGAVGFHRHKRRSRRSHRVLSSTCDHEATTPSLFAR